MLVDGSQAAVHLPVDVQDLDCDFYVFTGHKLYGPTGIGVLYGKKHTSSTMRPYQGGGEMIGYVTTDTVTYAKPPHRFEAGTPADRSGDRAGRCARLCRGASAARPSRRTRTC